MLLAAAALAAALAPAASAATPPGSNPLAPPVTSTPTNTHTTKQQAIGIQDVGGASRANNQVVRNGISVDFH